MLRKLRLRQENGFIIKKRVYLHIELSFTSMLDFSLVFFLLLSLRVALYSGFGFTRSSFTGGSSALIATVLLER